MKYPEEPTDISLTERNNNMTQKETENETLEIRTKIRTQLKKDGVVTLRVSYEGGGDEGSIGDVDIMIKGVKRYANMTPVSDDIYTMFLSILEDHACGWSENEGGRGIIYWNIKFDKIKLCHNEHYTGSHYSETEGL